MHVGAIKVLKTEKPFIIHKKNRHLCGDVFSGINLPINFQNVIKHLKIL
ncbi:sugar diacid recognition domain-containing protein [Peribacillus sp. NPDC060253]